MSHAWKNVLVVAVVGSVAAGRMLRPDSSAYFAGNGQTFNAEYSENARGNAWSSSGLSPPKKSSSPWTVNAPDRSPGESSWNVDRAATTKRIPTGGEWNNNNNNSGPKKNLWDKKPNAWNKPKPTKKPWNQGGNNWGRPTQPTPPPPPPPQQGNYPKKDKIDWGRIEKQNPEGPLRLDIDQLWRKAGKREASNVAGDAGRMPRACICVDRDDCDRENRADYAQAVLFDRRRAEVCAAANQVCCFARGPFFEDARAAEVRRLRTTADAPPCGKGLPVGDANPEGLADYGSFPWVLRLVYDDGDWARAACSAILVHRSVALTTASCVSDDAGETMRVRGGEWNDRNAMQERAVERIVVHPDFESAYLTNDLALLVLAEPFDDVGSVCLAAAGDEDRDVDGCVVVGWDAKNGNDGLEHPLLRQIDLAIISPGTCRNDGFNALQRDRNYSSEDAEGDFLCAYAKDEDPCTGDLASSIMCPLKSFPSAYSVAGLIHRGRSCRARGGRATFASVGRVADWIAAELADATISRY